MLKEVPLQAQRKEQVHAGPLQQEGAGRKGYETHGQRWQDLHVWDGQELRAKAWNRVAQDKSVG